MSIFKRLSIINTIILFITAFLLLLPYLPGSSSFFHSKIIEKLNWTPGNVLCVDKAPNDAVIMVYIHRNDTMCLVEYVTNNGSVYGLTLQKDLSTSQILACVKGNSSDELYYMISDETIKALHDELSNAYQYIDKEKKLHSALDGSDKSEQVELLLCEKPGSLDNFTAFYTLQEQQATVIDGTQSLYDLSQQIF